MRLAVRSIAQRSCAYLHVQLVHGNTVAAELLVLNGADLNAVDRFGQNGNWVPIDATLRRRTILCDALFLTAVAHIACQQDDAHSVKWLVGKDADFYHRDCRNKSPRDLIRREGAVTAYLDACEVPPCWWVGLSDKGVELAC